MTERDTQHLRALRRELIERFPVLPTRYWADFLGSALVGWTAFGVAAVVPWTSRWLPVALVAFVVAAMALLRAGYFVHEIAHQRRALPGFELAWNLIVGLWILVPSFMVDAHGDHHRLSTYGTARDPEYERVARFSRPVLVANVAVMLIVGPALALRFAVLAPLSWVFPPLRALVIGRLSALATNERYRNEHLDGSSARVVALEIAATAVVWSVIGAWYAGAIGTRLLLTWYVIVSIAFVSNQIRTLVAHAYEGTGDTLSFAEQVADSVTVHGPWWLTGIVYPVGTQHHALHHLAPSLAYHALPDAHRWLTAQGTPASYRAAERRGLIDAVAQLWARAHSAGARLVPGSHPVALRTGARRVHQATAQPGGFVGHGVLVHVEPPSESGRR